MFVVIASGLNQIYAVISAPVSLILAALTWYFARRYLEEKRIIADCIANPEDLLVINPDEEYRVRREKLNKAKNAAKDLDKGEGPINSNNSVSSGNDLSLNQSVSSIGIKSINSHGTSQFKRRDDKRSDIGTQTYNHFMYSQKEIDCDADLQFLTPCSIHFNYVLKVNFICIFHHNSVSTLMNSVMSEACLHRGKVLNAESFF